MGDDVVIAVRPPWEADVVAALNRYQTSGRRHEYTCGNDSSHVLVAGPDGWRCPVESCGYTQDWALASSVLAVISDSDSPVPDDGPVQIPDHVAGPFSVGSDVWPGLAKVAEEMGEAIQVIGKLIATGGKPSHWDGEGDLVRRLDDELVDVEAAMTFLRRHSPVMVQDVRDPDGRFARKLARLERWHEGGRS